MHGSSAGPACRGADWHVQQRAADGDDLAVERRAISRRPTQGTRRSSGPAETDDGRRGLGHAGAARLSDAVRGRLQDRQRGQPREVASHGGPCGDRRIPADARRPGRLGHREREEREPRRPGRAERVGDRHAGEARRDGDRHVRQGEQRHHHRRQPGDVDHDQDRQRHRRATARCAT